MRRNTHVQIERRGARGSTLHRLQQLGPPNQQPIGINLMQLTIAPDEAMAELARLLIERVQHSESTTLARNEIIEVITTIAVYKFSKFTREEVEAMLGISLEQTRIYQDAKAEGREEGREQGREEQKAEMLRATVPLLLKTGMSVEQIAQQLHVDVEAVQQAVIQNT